MAPSRTLRRCVARTTHRHDTAGISLILLTVSRGYIGGHLLRRLEKRKLNIRCLARQPEILRSRADPTTEIIAGTFSTVQASTPRSLEWMSPTISFIRWVRADRSRKRTGKVLLISGTPPGQLGSSASFTWAASVEVTKCCLRTWKAARKSVEFCVNRVYLCWNFVRQC